MNLSFSVLNKNPGIHFSASLNKLLRKSSYKVQLQIKCCSSSMAPELHKMHFLSEMSFLVKRPVSIANGKTPHLSCATKDLTLLEILINIYFSGPDVVLNLINDRSFGNDFADVLHSSWANSHTRSLSDLKSN